MTKRDFKVAAGTLVSGLFLLILIVGVHKIWNRGGGPDPSPDDGPKAKGEYVVVIVNDNAPTVAEGLVLDGPQFDALRLAGKATIRSTKWAKLAEKNYGPLVTEASGTPALIVLTKAGEKCYAGKLPETETALQALLAKYVTALPPPTPPAKSLPVVDPGGDLKVEGDGTPFVDVGGHKRFLTAKPAPQKMRALPRYADDHPTFPITQWHDIDRRDVFPWDVWGLDQNGHGSCVAQAGVYSLKKNRWLHGMFPQQLSPGCLYSQINGGRDEGASISDAPQALAKTGTVLFKTVGQNPIYTRQMPAGWKDEAARFKVADWYRCQTWEELGSALQTGRYTAMFGVMVGSNFGHFDKYGVCGHDHGQGNHALSADGMKKLPDGRWVLDVPNSWGLWGPWKNGRCYLDRNHLFANGDMPDICVIRAGTDDPKDPHDPPAYVGRVATIPPETP